MTAAQYILNTAAAYNSMLNQQYMMHSPVMSPQPQHVKRKPVQYFQAPSPYIPSPQLEQRIHRKKVAPQRQETPQQQTKKKVRFDEVPTLYTYEPEESEEEDHEDHEESYYYTHPYIKNNNNNNNNNNSSSDSWYTSDRPWSSNAMLSNRLHYYDDRYEAFYDEDDEEIDPYGELWEKRYYIRRHDSLGHRPPIRKSRV
ncbi:hypothetical protein BY458DRAFT_437864 [Sporodiniella umbellata]|nr:hypothetical protein BY458DRAFT_437864 [Sporodiniella umbellata]